MQSEQILLALPQFRRALGVTGPQPLNQILVTALLRHVTRHLVVMPDPVQVSTAVEQEFCGRLLDEQLTGNCSYFDSRAAAHFSS
jgi:hypothetical protein